MGLITIPFKNLIKLTVGFMIVNNLNIDNMNCNQNIEDQSKREHSIKYSQT